jgi:hypothetical protein
MIDPATIPRIDGDMAALTAHADGLTRTGIAIADTGERVHSTWQQLAAVYIAPEANELFAVTGPVMSISASVGEDIGDAAAALRAYAGETATIQTRLEALRAQAVDLVAAASAAQDESTIVTLEDRSAELSAAVAVQIAEWEAAQRRCANAVRQLYSESPSAGYVAGMTLVESGGGAIITPRGPTGPSREIFPIDPFPPVSSTGNPPVLGGPGVLVNVPAPPTTGTVDGPGSFVPPTGSGIFTNRSATGSEAGGEPDGAAEGGPPPKPDPKLEGIFDDGGAPPASELEDYAKGQGWERRQTETGPPTYVDENGVRRIVLKEGSPRTPGSETPHVELRDASGQRIDPQGNPVSKRSPGNHTPISWDLTP